MLIRHLHGDATRLYYADNNSIVASPTTGIKDDEAAEINLVDAPRRA